MIKIAAIINLILTFFLLLADFFQGHLDLALCHAVTSGLLTINLLGLVFVVHQLFNKKSIALPLLIIILKYPIIVAVIVYLSKQSWVTSIGVLTSVLLFVLSFIAAHILLKVRGQYAF